MISQNKHVRKDGFTIVELLIVIVVIGILAAITIVAFNGIQNRGKAASAQSLANSVTKKAEAYNSVSGQYPTFAQLQNNQSTTSTTANTGPQEARLDSTTQVTATAGDITGDTGTARVQYVPCGTTGARIHYWDYTASPAVLTTPTATGNKSLTIGTGCV